MRLNWNIQTGDMRGKLGEAFGPLWSTMGANYGGGSGVGDDAFLK